MRQTLKKGRRPQAPPSNVPRTRLQRLTYRPNASATKPAADTPSTNEPEKVSEGRSSAAKRGRPVKRHWPVFAAAFAFSFGLIALAPATLLRPVIDRSGANVSYERIDGLVWRGVIRRLTVDGFDLGDVVYSANPLPLLTGRLSFDMSLNGAAVQGGGRFSINPFTRSVDFRNSSVVFDLSSIKRYSLFGIPYQGKVRLGVERFVWAPAKGCQRAAAKIWTDALNAPMQRFGGEGATFAGPVKCDGQNIVLSLIGANALGEADIAISISPELTYSLAVEVSSAQPQTRQSLQAIGFQEKDGILFYDAYGPIRGLGS